MPNVMSEGDIARKVSRLPGSSCRLDPGDGVQLILRCLKGKLEGRYVGTDMESLLLFSLPLIPRIKERLLVDNGVVIKYQRQGGIYQFQSHVLRIILRPTPLLLVAVPSLLFRIDLRTAPRISCMLPMSLQGRFGEHEGVICDLSEHGIRARFKLTGPSGLRKVQAGDSLVSTFSLGDFGEIMAGVTVRRVETRMDAVTLGLQISELDADEAQAIKGYIEKILFILN
ncbi:type IV pilus assembly PilZ [Desulfovibrio sp. X2]|uniref:flagellar brake protein n=1 Tax=Desulfovibrio sp. X2 TaxID=941449 RepID=UPI000358A124|nr:PilZ domain-containing protein [Desulfovibrio sp. X2]EPR43802.1 type IV pilus assembly PilZ [Desulfovibrio sp. X2]